MVRAIRELFDRWRSLRGVRVIDQRYRKDYSRWFGEQVSLALEAAVRGDHEEALKIWQEVGPRFTEQAATSPRVLLLLLKIGAFDELDAMMEEGRRRHPSVEHFAKGYVQAALYRGDSEETLRRCRLVREQFPKLADGYVVASECLAKLGRHDEAEAIVERAINEVPPGLDLLAGYARHAERRKDWKEALHRWELVRNLYDHVQSHNGIAHCFRQMHRFDEAEIVARRTCDRFPTDPWAFATLAAIAADRGDLDEAARRWDYARRRRPSFGYAYGAGARAERRLGREMKADEILASGVEMVRGDLELHLEYARSAHRRGDWATAMQRWDLVRERFPECEEARQRSAEASDAASQGSVLPAGVVAASNNHHAPSTASGSPMDG